MSDFRELLNKPLSGVKPPPALAAGTYYGTITSYKIDDARFADKETGERGKDCIYTMRISGHGDDVPEEDFRETKAMGKLISANFPLDEAGMWRLKNFWESLGIDTATLTGDVAMPKAVGAQVMFTVTRRADKNDSERFYNDARNVRALAA